MGNGNNWRNVKRLMGSVEIFVIQWNGLTLKMSKPCKDCLHLMKLIGIRKITFTNEKGNFVFSKVNKLHTDHVSISRRKMKTI